MASLVDISADELTQTGVLERLDQSGRGVIARGMGRSYGDPAQNGGGTVIRISDGDIAVNSAQGSVRVGAGISLDTLLREIIPLGWFVPVTPAHDSSRSAGQSLLTSTGKTITSTVRLAHTSSN